MTPDEEARIRALHRLIAEERDPIRSKVLAAELERLLSMKVIEIKTRK